MASSPSNDEPRDPEVATPPPAPSGAATSDDSAAEPAEQGATGRRARVLRLVFGLVAIAALVVLAREAGGSVPAIARWVEGLGVWGPLVFVLVYAAGTVLFFPGAVMTLVGGALFGVLEGVVVVWSAATLGSGLAFLIARYAARGWVEAQIARSEKFSAVDRAVADSGLKITFLLRLSPVFPFNFLNYALGLTRVTFRDYMLAAVGMLPGTLLYVYYGRVIGDVAAVASGADVERGAGYYAVTVLGLAATIAVTAVVTRVARRALGTVADV